MIEGSMMIDMADETVQGDAVQRDETELSPCESPTEHAYAWALDAEDEHVAGHYGWRPVLIRAAVVFGVFLAAAGVIIALWWTGGKHFVARQRASAPTSSTVAPVPVVAAPAPAPATVTVTAAPSPSARTETPTQEADSDVRYLDLVSQIPMVITDPAVLIASGHSICRDLSHRYTAAQIAAANTHPGRMTYEQAFGIVNAATAIYCPQYGISE